jgi:predicted RNA polymerase sigma factor
MTEETSCSLQAINRSLELGGWRRLRLHRAIALRYTTGPQAALEELDTLADALDRHHLYHATRAELLRALGHPYQARSADERALRLTANPAEQALLQQRIDWT